MGRFFLKRKQRTKTQPVLYINNNESLIFMATLNLIVLFFVCFVCVCLYPIIFGCTVIVLDHFNEVEKVCKKVNLWKLSSLLLNHEP